MAWRDAESLTFYLRASFDWQYALQLAQHRGTGNSSAFPPAKPEERFATVDAWRVAIAKQLLTPAPDGRAIAWKRAKLAGGDFKHLPVSRERVKQAIADDVAFLAAHPVRQSKREA